MREAEFLKLDVSLNMNAEYLEANEKEDHRLNIRQVKFIP